MPKKLVHHCAMRRGNLIYIYGGFEWPDIPNYETFIFSLKTKSWRALNSRSDCGVPMAHERTTCAFWKNIYFVVASLDITTKKSCTAILNLETERWSKLHEDIRYPIVSGYLLK